MKYEKNTKVRRNKLIIELRDTQPVPSFQEIADTLGMTKQRVAFIYNRDKGKK